MNGYYSPPSGKSFYGALKIARKIEPVYLVFNTIHVLVQPGVTDNDIYEEYNRRVNVQLERIENDATSN